MENRAPIRDPLEARRARDYLIRMCSNGHKFLTHSDMNEQDLCRSLELYEFSESDQFTRNIDLTNFHALCLRNLDEDQWRQLLSMIGSEIMVLSIAD